MVSKNHGLKVKLGLAGFVMLASLKVAAELGPGAEGPGAGGIVNGGVTPTGSFSANPRQASSQSGPVTCTGNSPVICTRGGQPVEVVPHGMH